MPAKRPSFILCGLTASIAACHITVVEPPSKPEVSATSEEGAPADSPAPSAEVPLQAPPPEPIAATPTSVMPPEKSLEPPTSQPSSTKLPLKGESPNADAAKTPTVSPQSAEPASEPEQAPETDSSTITVKTVIVLREGTNHQLGANVFRVGEAAPFASTPAGGVASPNRTCERNRDQFDAKALVGDFFDVVPKVPCAEELRFELAFSRDVARVEQLGDEAMSAGRAGEAFIFYLTAAERLSRTDANAAKIANSKAARALAQALGVDSPLQLKSGRQVLQPKAIAKLKALQARSGLPATGALDRATRKALGGIDEADAMRKAAAAPALAPQEIRRAPQRAPQQR